MVNPGIYHAGAIKNAISSLYSGRGVIGIVGDSNLFQDTTSGYLQGQEKGAHTDGPGLWASYLMPCQSSSGTYSSTQNGALASASSFDTLDAAIEEERALRGFLPYIRYADGNQPVVNTTFQRRIAELQYVGSNANSIFDVQAAWDYELFHLAQSATGGNLYVSARGTVATTSRLTETGQAYGPIVNTDAASNGVKAGDLLRYTCGIQASGSWTQELVVALYRWNSTSGGVPEGPLSALYQRFVKPTATTGVSYAPLIAIGGENSRNLLERLQRHSPMANQRWMQAAMWGLPNDAYFIFNDLMLGNDHADTAASWNPDSNAWDGPAGQQPLGVVGNFLGIREQIRAAWALTGRPADRLVFIKGPYHDRPTIAEGDTSNWVIDGTQRDWSDAMTLASEALADALTERGIRDTCVLNGAEVVPYNESGSGDELQTANFNDGPDYAHLDRDGFEKYGRQFWRAMDSIRNSNAEQYTESVYGKGGLRLGLGTEVSMQSVDTLGRRAGYRP